ncbi:DUF4114 domain-containing protein (plasmid) [Tistrella bauzanensis]|uniref:DUF4114 domain-containing protein n=1 Tax=Tistrella TaxID=171436 RepID=UPI0031F6FAEB
MAGQTTNDGVLLGYQIGCAIIHWNSYNLTQFPTFLPGVVPAIGADWRQYARFPSEDSDFTADFMYDLGKSLGQIQSALDIQGGPAASYARFINIINNSAAVMVALDFSLTFASEVERCVIQHAYPDWLPDINESDKIAYRASPALIMEYIDQARDMSAGDTASDDGDATDDAQSGGTSGERNDWRINKGIAGTHENDTIEVGDGQVTIINALAGDDTIIGGGKSDRIFGGAGDDIISGGAGPDIISGGIGTDTYVIAPFGGSDVYQDQGQANEYDRIVITGFSPDDIRFVFSPIEADNLLVRNLSDGSLNIFVGALEDGGADQIEAITFDDGTVLTRQDIVAALGDEARKALGDADSPAEAPVSLPTVSSDVDVSGGGNGTADVIIPICTDMHDGMSDYEREMINPEGAVTQADATGRLSLAPQLGDDDDNQLNGTSGHDVILGGDGDDILQGLLGDDRLDGGAGDDVLQGDTAGAGPQLADGEPYRVGYHGGSSTLSATAVEVYIREGETARLDIAITLDDALDNLIGRQNLQGDGEKTATVRFVDETAGFRNTFGSYIVMPDGQISDVKILFDDASLNPLTSGDVVDAGLIAEGAELGFFLIADGFSTYGALDGSLSFVNPITGCVATVFDDVPPVLIEDGVVRNRADIIHMARDSLNIDGLNRTRYFIDETAGSISFGIEDDIDFDLTDIVFEVDTHSEIDRSFDLVASIIGDELDYASLPISSYHDVEAATYVFQVDIDASNNIGYETFVLDVNGVGRTEFSVAILSDDADILSGGDGNDRLIGFRGEDIFDGGAGDDQIRPGTGVDTITLGFGKDIIEATLASITGDTITDFSSGDSLVLTGHTVSRELMEFNADDSRFAVENGTEASWMMAGDFTSGDFMAVAGEAQTTITFERFLPMLTDRQAVDTTSVNGVINPDFLTGDGKTDFTVSLLDIGVADYDNALGVYEVNTVGDLVDARLLAANTKTAMDESFLITDVDRGHQLGFFILQNGAGFAEGLADDAVLRLVDATGRSANIDGVRDIMLSANGATVDHAVFQTTADALNNDGVRHVLSGVEAGGKAILIGFEDLTGGGDRDYEDVVMRVEALGSAAAFLA